MKGKPNQQAKRRERREGTKAVAQAKAAPAVAPTTTPATPTCQPIAPRPVLFRVLMVGFIAWVGVLLALYFSTVYPMRHAGTSATTAPATR